MGNLGGGRSRGNVGTNKKLASWCSSWHGHKAQFVCTRAAQRSHVHPIEQLSNQKAMFVLVSVKPRSESES